MKLGNLVRLGSRSVLELIENGSPACENKLHIQKALEWLCLAQDSSGNGGVSEGYHLYHGWLPPYPETTGYIIETFFNCFHATRDENFRSRALRMADWLLSVQNEDGSLPDSYFKRKMVFDTGQVIFGLVKSYEESGMRKYKKAAEKAADWLTGIQEKDGSWIHFSVGGIPHTYYSRVAWSLLRVHEITSNAKYINSCRANIDWCLKQQHENGWFGNASFTLKNHERPFTHTIAYTIDGILESGLYLDESRYVFSARKALDGICARIPQNGRVAGTCDRNWDGDHRFTCLTGNAQLAINFLRFYGISKSPGYLRAASAINAYLKSRQIIRTQNRNLKGAIAGSYPIWGRYIHFTYPNWAAKFFLDALLLEEHTLSHGGQPVQTAP